VLLCRRCRCSLSVTCDNWWLTTSFYHHFSDEFFLLSLWFKWQFLKVSDLRIRFDVFLLISLALKWLLKFFIGRVSGHAFSLVVVDVESSIAMALFAIEVYGIGSFKRYSVGYFWSWVVAFCICFTLYDAWRSTSCENRLSWFSFLKIIEEFLRIHYWINIATCNATKSSGWSLPWHVLVGSLRSGLQFTLNIQNWFNPIDIIVQIHIQPMLLWKFRRLFQELFSDFVHFTLLLVQ